MVVVSVAVAACAKVPADPPKITAIAYDSFVCILPIPLLSLFFHIVAGIISNSRNNVKNFEDITVSVERKP